MKSSSESPRDRSSRSDGANRTGTSRAGSNTPSGSPSGPGSPKPGDLRPTAEERNRNDIWDDDEVPAVMIEEEDEGVLEISDDEDLEDEDIEDDYTDEGDDDLPIVDEQRQRSGS